MSPSSDDPGLERLAAALQASPTELGYLGALDTEAQERLVVLVSSAVERDARELDEALERTVRFIPRPFRGRARRILVPEDDR